jgi:hypothetical protein
MRYGVECIPCAAGGLARGESSGRAAPGLRVPWGGPWRRRRSARGRSWRRCPRAATVPTAARAPARAAPSPQPAWGWAGRARSGCCWTGPGPAAARPCWGFERHCAAGAASAGVMIDDRLPMTLARRGSDSGVPGSSGGSYTAAASAAASAAVSAAGAAVFAAASLASAAVGAAGSVASATVSAAASAVSVAAAATAAAAVSTVSGGLLSPAVQPSPLPGAPGSMNGGTGPPGAVREGGRMSSSGAAGPEGGAGEPHEVAMGGPPAELLAAWTALCSAAAFCARVSRAEEVMRRSAPCLQTTCV